MARISKQEHARRAAVTALHESAHAVVIELFGGRVTGLRVNRRLPDYGACYSEWRVRRGQTDRVARAIVSMAGHAAEVQWYGRAPQQIPTTDYGTIRWLGCRGLSIQAAHEMAMKAVRANRAMIWRVSRALLATGSWRLNRRDFLRACR